MYSKLLLTLVVLLSLVAFVPVYINVLAVPAHLLLHALLVLGLLKVPDLRLSLSATQFAAWTSLLPLVVWVGFAGLALVREPGPADWSGMLLITGYTLVVCILEFLVARLQYQRWRLSHSS